MSTTGYRILRNHWLVIASVFLCGCGSSSFDITLPEDRQDTPRTALYVENQIDTQLAHMEKNLKDFSMFFAQQDKDIKLPNRQVLKTDNITLNRAIFIDWSGPIEQLVADLGKLSGYQTQVIGASPVIPPLVSLHHERIKILDVIRDAALQVHQKADLIVFPDERLIELRYR